jgi:hypothetical protein
MCYGSKTCASCRTVLLFLSTVGSKWRNGQSTNPQKRGMSVYV